MNKLVLNNLISLKNGSRLKKNYVDCCFNKFFLELLLFFYKNNFILGYVFISKYKLRIYYKYYKDKGIFDNLVIPSTLKSMITYNRIMYVYERSIKVTNNILLVLLTSKGFYTLSEYMRLQLRIGGFIFFMLYL